MFSKLSKGYGSWHAGYVDPYYGEKRQRAHTLPEIDLESHCHGVTIGPHSGRSTAMSTHRSREPTSDSLPLPKTYTTRRGALQIYVAPEDEEEEEEDEGLALKPPYVQIKRPSGQELIDLSLKLGTMDRLAMSVLQFGDQEYDHDHTSISDAKNKAFLKFLHSIDNGGTKTQTQQDSSVQPGGDLNTYLRELRSSSSMRYFSDGSTYLPKSRESMELQAILRGLDAGWPLSWQQDSTGESRNTPGQFTRPVSRVSSRGPSPGPPSTPRSTYQVLSSKKLAASIKSGSYLGRPSSTLADEDSESEMSLPGHVTSASVNRLQWSPSDSQDDDLLQLREQFYKGTDEEGTADDSKKRRRFKERSYLTGSDLLYQGRNTYIVDGSHVNEVKGTSRGDGNSEGKGHGMLEIVEETGEGKVGNTDIGEKSETDSVVWADNVASVQRLNSESEQEIQMSSGPAINIEVIDETPSRKSSAKSLSRPGSNTSVSTTQSSKHTPTIISIQVSDPSRTPVSKTPDKLFVGLKRRKSLSNTLPNTPDKSRYIFPGNRLKSPKQPREQVVDSSAYDGRHEEPVYKPLPRSYTFGAGVMNWSVGGETAAPEPVTIPPDNTPDLSHEQAHLATNTPIAFAEELLVESRPDSGHSDAQSLNELNRYNDVTGPEEFLKEEDILDNLQKCNEEVEQIEAKGEHVDDSSDSGTYVDEEDMIQVIKEVEREQRLNQDTADGFSRNSGLIAEETDEVRCDSRGPDGEVVEKDKEEEMMEVDTDKDVEETVDEVYDETQSSIRSRRSSRLSKIRTTKDGTSEIGSPEDSDDQALPSLLSDQLETKDAFKIAAELDALGLRQPVQNGKKKKKKEKGSSYVPPPPPSKRVEAPKEEAKLPDHLQDLLNRQPSASTEHLERDLERMTDLVDESLSGPTLEAIGEGLTEEELELAKQILQKKIEEAKGKIDGKEVKSASGKKKAAAKPVKKGGKKKKTAEDTRTEEEIERDMIRQKHEMEKQNRDKEAAELQRKIKERRMMLQMQENMAEEKQKEIREKMEALEREADDLQRAEDEARDILAEVRRKQREERESRRRADLERKRVEASERRERERKEMEEKRKKESEMLEKIADAEMRRRLREEEERKAYEAERIAQEKYEEEMREAQRVEEEEEERLKEMERQAEEEAMQRLIEEREAAERQRRRLMEEEEALKEAERKKMEIMQEEERRLEEARQRMEAEENAKREAERQRLLELRRLEEEARIRMQEEVEKRRGEAMARRDYNLENKQNVDKLKHGQGITRAWTFSYFVHWPRETYERPIGGADPRKVVKIKNPPPKKAEPSAENTGQAVAQAT